MTAPSDARCCFFINLRIGVFVYLALSIVLSATSVVAMSSVLQVGSSSSNKTVGVLVNIVFAALTLYFAVKRMGTAYKVCVYVHGVLYLLIVAVVILFFVSGSLVLPSGEAKPSFNNVDETVVKRVLTLVPPAAIAIVVLAIQAYFMSVLWRYTRVMQDEIAQRKQKQVAA
ncbi:hypothetical protein BCR44DRAFT_1427871 [Catenaria anguillulae PL171]|uniref:Uncharacterized protein n=1 Tax=Catenaria anguillulae PL171 TaxID=765915 RepID=A0A1Y2HYL7_9FUNG|nr:hypothetical protein BCR44DRAFT_1427871 [Catenaria anguillulae PL171]